MGVVELNSLNAEFEDGDLDSFILESNKLFALLAEERKIVPDQTAPEGAV